MFAQWKRLLLSLPSSIQQVTELNFHSLCRKAGSSILLDKYKNAQMYGIKSTTK